jgi:hypothetical protein
MKTKLLTGLALAAALLIGQPAFAHSNKGGGKGAAHHAVAAVHRGGGGHGGGRSMVAYRGGGGGHARMAKVSGAGAFRGPRVANSRVNTGRTFAPTNVAANRNLGRAGRSSVAFGGNSYNARNGRSGGGGSGNAQYAFSSHQGWSHDREYDWRGHHYQWFNNAWFIIDPYPYDAYYPYGGYGPNGSDSVAVQVQQDLAHDGYYQGPIDGVVGPGTRAAVAAYQRDNGLPPTGNIDGNLLSSLNGT